MYYSFKKHMPSANSTLLPPSNDTTLAGTPNNKPKTKPIDDLECALAYNDYLQMLMKETIVNETIQEQSQILKDQMAVNSDTLYQLELDEKLSSKKEQQLLEKRNEILNSVEEFLKRLAGVQDLLKAEMEEFDQGLETLCNKIFLENVCPLEDQDKFVEFANHCTGVVENLKKTQRNIKESECITSEIKKLFRLKEEVERKIGEVLEQQEKMASTWLKKTSDALANN